MEQRKDFREPEKGKRSVNPLNNINIYFLSATWEDNKTLGENGCMVRRVRSPDASHEDPQVIGKSPLNAQRARKQQSSTPEVAV